MNNNNISTFRWPFFAYATAPDEVAISVLYNQEFLIHHELAFESEEDKKGSIQKMDFSHDGNLYVLYSNDNLNKLYRLEIKDKAHGRHKLNQYSSHDVRNSDEIDLSVFAGGEKSKELQ